MAQELLIMVVRRLLIMILAYPVVNSLLGAEVVEWLSRNEAATWIASLLGTLILLAWSAWDKIKKRVWLRTAMRAPPTVSLQEVKADVATLTVGETVSESLR